LCRYAVARAVQRRSLPKVLAALRDGTLAVSRVVWAETDEVWLTVCHSVPGTHVAYS
jgi:hypothetical protein